jgi:hypothetical protein
MTEMTKEKVLQILEAARDAIVSEYEVMVDNSHATSPGWYERMSDQHKQELAEFDTAVAYIMEKL